MEPARLPDVGDRFLDKWTIEEQVGKGGFSIVYRAVDDDGGVAAVKILTPEATNKVTSKSYDAEIADRFLREARLLEQLDCAYTIRLWDYGESPEKLLYMVFEYIDGRMLFDEIKAHGGLDHDRVVHVMRQTLIALESAHALGILHRDIKPNNIMLYERDGDPDRVKLVDFGIAKMFDDDNAMDGNDLTAAGLLVGTPRYMSPEQLMGQDLGPPSDLYSLGLCAIEMISGRKCIPGKDRIKIVEQQLRPEQIRIPDDVTVDAGLAAIVHRLTEKKQPNRYPSATEALRDLEALAGDPGATGDTVYQTIPADIGSLLAQPADENDDTVFETVNTAELAAYIDQHRPSAQSLGESKSDGTIDPFGVTMASQAIGLSDLDLLRATDSTVEGRAEDFQPSFGELSGSPSPSPSPSRSPLQSPYGQADPSGFQSSFDALYGGGPAAAPPPPASQSYGSGQFPQPPVSPAGQSYGSGQFPQPPVSPAGQSYGSGQFPQPPVSPAGQSYGSGQFPQPPPPGGYGSGQFPQPPLDQNYGSGQFPQPGYGPPPGHPQSLYNPNTGPPQPHQLQPQWSGDDKLVLGAAFVVPGVGQVIAGQVVKGVIIMVLLLLLVVFISGFVWPVFALLSFADAFLLIRAQKRRPVGPYEFFADYRSLL